MKITKAIGRIFLVSAALMLVVSLIGFASLAYAQSQPLNASQIIEKSNFQRELIGAKKLNINEQLMNAAQKKAEHMAKNQYFSHNLPDGTAPWQFIQNSGYEYLEAGENLAITNQSDSQVVDGWMNSLTHKENLLNKNFSDIGVGIAYFGNYSNYKNTFVVVAFYGKPGKQENVPIEVQPTSPAGGIAIVEQKDFIGPYGVYAIIGGALLVAGIIIELLHISANHRRSIKNI
jgi:hypothetical protein